ncbi:MAG: type II secretion system F family protein [Candidatus Hydrogenedentes bacterium]|nr:type II secretion system F family protein [Candidatus Hydrogenedentota bacterium]
MGLFSPELTTKQLALLCKSLTVMSEGSITLERSLELLSTEHASRSVRHALVPIVDALQRGETVGNAFRSQSRRFPEFFLEMVDVGERTGSLDTVFRILTEEYEQRAELIRFYVQGAAYPAGVLIAAVIGIPILRIFLMGVAGNNGNAGAGIALFLWSKLVFYGSLFLIVMVLGHTGVLQRISWEIGSRIWVLKGITSEIALARFFRALAICLDAGLSIVPSIERAAAVTTHPKIRKGLLKAVPLVQQGMPLETALAETGLMPEMALTMVHTGEFAGKLDELLNKTAQYLYEGARHRTQMLSIAVVTLMLVIGLVLYLTSALFLRAIEVLLRLTTL